MQTFLKTKLLAGMSVLLLLSACGEKEEKKSATQAAARVNGAEITVHQINQVLSRATGVTEENVQRARNEVLTRLVDQQLTVEQALANKLDRKPEVVAALEAARREVLSRAYIDDLIGKQAKPTLEEAKKYYADHPQLFAERRVYSLQEIAIEKNEEILPALREKLASVKSLEELADWLKSKNVRFATKAGVRPAEQIPLELLAVLHPMKVGQATLVTAPQGYGIVRIAAAQSAPVDEATAMPSIQQFLANQRNREALDREMKQLREKAKIEYLGDFASLASKPAQAEPAAQAPTLPSPPAVPGEDAKAGAALGDVGKAVGALK